MNSGYVNQASLWVNNGEMVPSAGQMHATQFQFIFSSCKDKYKTRLWGEKIKSRLHIFPIAQFIM